MIGLGAGLSCAEWLEAGAADTALEQWAFGFASAIAASTQLSTGADPLAPMTAASIRASLTTYCRQRPSDTLGVALVRLVLSGVPGS